jgi:tripartite-type tricarboxylate transporter receptor subunit TctC
MISTTRKSGLPSAIIVAAAITAKAIAGLGMAHAQCPDRGLTLIVPYGAGGGTDDTARPLARDLEVLTVTGLPIVAT